MIMHSFVAALLTASAGGEHAGSINPLEWQTDLALWTAVVFLGVMAILWRFAWKPIVEGLDKRERSVADHIAQAEAANRKANELLADYQRQLSEAGGQVRAMLDQGRREAEQAGRELLDRAKAEAQAEHARALKQIDEAAASAMKELAAQSATLAVQLAGKIVQSKLAPADHARLIDQAVAGFIEGRN